MKTVTQTAIDPKTDQEYDIELPAHDVVREAILKLDFTPEGIRVKETTEKLVKHFKLSNKEKSAVKKSGSRYLDLFRYNLVAPAFKYLLKKGKIIQPEGRGKPYFLAEESTPLFPVHPISSPHEESIEKIYENKRKELISDILDEINKLTPDIFEKLVVQLLIKMGYGGPWDDAGEVTGGPGDGGIDGIINQDKLGLEVVGIQAKLRTTGNNVSPSVINEFVGALRLQGLTKGVIITTANFSKNAQQSAEGSDNPKIALIDGERLAKLMIDHDVGVSTVDSYIIKRVDSDFFIEIKH